MLLFYTPRIVGEYAYFEIDETRHLTQVLRKKIGDTVHLTDGKGRGYMAQISEITKKECIAHIVSSQMDNRANVPRLHLAIAPTKNIDRIEWFLEKATEIGISEITPILCQHSERDVIKWERLNGILISAMKQSLHFTLPILHPLMPFQELVKSDFLGQKFICYCNDTTLQPLKTLYTQRQNVTIMIGPEGDFSEKEIKLAIENDFVGTSLGDTRLRTETAGLVAVHTISLLNQ